MNERKSTERKFLLRHCYFDSAMLLVAFPLDNGVLEFRYGKGTQIMNEMSKNYFFTITMSPKIPHRNSTGQDTSQIIATVRYATLCSARCKALHDSILQVARCHATRWQKQVLPF